jgi:hypothetical protein
MGFIERRRRREYLEEVARTARQQRDEARRRALIPLDEVAEVIQERIRTMMVDSTLEEILHVLHDPEDPLTATSLMIVLCDRAK